MKAKATKKIEKKLIMWTLVIGAILAIPLVSKAPWTVGDYIFAGIVLSVCAAMYEFITKNMNSRLHRIAVGVAILFLIALIIAWAATGPPDEAARFIAK